jgi:hypothetical protein
VICNTALIVNIPPSVEGESCPNIEIESKMRKVRRLPRKGFRAGTRE